MDPKKYSTQQQQTTNKRDDTSSSHLGYQTDANKLFQDSGREAALRVLDAALSCETKPGQKNETTVFVVLT